MKNPWLGDERGYLSDWTTQQWVRASGRVVDLDEAPWLRGPTGPPSGIGDAYFERYALQERLRVVEESPDAGLVPSFAALAGPGFDPAAVRDEVVDFYERTARYRLHLWSEWSSCFRPFGRLVETIFARRLRQLQLPMGPLDTSRGVSSRLIQLTDGDGRLETAWLRRRQPDGEVIYAGFYEIEHPPAADRPCVKVVFPLPNGNASVFLRPVAHDDGSLELISATDEIGGPGFHFVVVRDDRTVWARAVPQMTERIHVYPDGDGELHTDHVLSLWGRTFLRLHYAMTRSA